jgi:hypothetical protein
MPAPCPHQMARRDAIHSRTGMGDFLSSTIITPEQACTMPRSVLADSDDDAEHSLEPAVSPRGIARTTGADNAGATAQSTGSTERIHRDIRQAEHDLLAPTADAQSSISKSASPSFISGKRRYTTSAETASSPSSEKRVKRSKTLTTYSKHRASAQASERSPIGDNVHKPDIVTSHMARFSEHSTQASCTAPPAGSVQADFACHEPNVLFRDSGSTVIDGESSQQRMIDLARNSGTGLSTSASRVINSEEPQESSFPWSASHTTQSAKKASMPLIDHESSLVISKHRSADAKPSQAVFSQSCCTMKESLAQICGPIYQMEHHSAMLKSCMPTTEPRRPPSSPTVEISAVSTPSPARDDRLHDSMVGSARRERRAAQTEVSELNSDDPAIGVPKERYKPRPSKRRATPALDEPIDYSILPEKAAKLKRAKTAAASKGADTPDTPIKSNHLSQATSLTKQSIDVAPTANDAAAQQSSIENKAACTAEDVSSELAIKAHNSPQPGDATLDLSPKAQSNGRHPADNDEIFVKPQVPKPKPASKSTSKTRRSHTTIYEDHVDFSRSPRSLTLSQQQANREAALDTIEQNLPQSAAKLRKRRNMIDASDEDDENLVPSIQSGDERSETMTAPPSLAKKRSRGGPPKSSTAGTTEVLESVATQLAIEQEHGDERGGEPRASQECRDSPAKPALPDVEELPVSQVVQSVADDNGTKDEEGTADVHLADGATGKYKSELPAASQRGEHATPSPKKPEKAQSVAVKTPTESSPTSHSPIKASSSAPLRVGLSKRSRIPPLLRMVKPVRR